MKTRPARVAILGTGKIGIDLLFKVRRSEKLCCVLVVGRNSESYGLKIAKEQGVEVSDQGLSAVLERENEIDILFDATSALAHVKHWEALQNTNIKVVDMTPSKLGEAIIPAVNLSDAEKARHINMVSCGGQSSIPIVNAVSGAVNKLNAVEIVSSIASKSAGPATRLNLDEYIHTTERGLLHFSGAGRSKVILILNPAEPPINMQTTIWCQIENPPMEAITSAVKNCVQTIKRYVPGYELLVEPTRTEADRIVMMIKVVGVGDYLPRYAGNLDIINCAAVAAAEKMAVTIA